MRQDECWERFAKSGSVQDYLGYCDVRSRAQEPATDGRTTEYAGFSDSYGDGVKDDSCRRI